MRAGASSCHSAEAELAVSPELGTAPTVGVLQLRENREVDDEFKISPGRSGSQIGIMPEGKVEEGTRPLATRISSAPTQIEIDEHNLTHVPFRSWWKRCVCGRAVNYGHYVKKEHEEQQVPVISMDYMYLKSSDEAADLNFLAFLC